MPASFEPSPLENENESNVGEKVSYDRMEIESTSNDMVQFHVTLASSTSNHCSMC